MSAIATRRRAEAATHTTAPKASSEMKSAVVDIVPRDGRCAEYYAGPTFIARQPDPHRAMLEHRIYCRD